VLAVVFKTTSRRTRRGKPGRGPGGNKEVNTPGMSKLNQCPINEERRGRTLIVFNSAENSAGSGPKYDFLNSTTVQNEIQKDREGKGARKTTAAVTERKK